MSDLPTLRARVEAAQALASTWTKTVEVDDFEQIMARLVASDTSLTLAADLLTLAESQAAELTAIRAALGNGTDESAWPPGMTVPEAVARLRVLVHEPDATFCGNVVSEREGDGVVFRTLCPLPAGHAGSCVEALADDGGTRG